MVIGITVVVLAASVGYSLTQSKLYAASSTVYLSEVDLASALSNIQTPVSSTEPDRIAQTQAEIALAPAIAGATIHALGLDQSLKGLLSHVSVTAAANADILTVTVSQPRPGLAIRVADEYAYQYTRYRTRLDTSSIVLAEHGVQQTLTRLSSQGQKGSTLYQNLENKLDQLNTMAALESSGSTIASRPFQATQVQPDPVRDGILGLVVGLLLGIVAAVIRQSIDTRVRSADELRDGLALPVLGMIPAPPSDVVRKRGLVMVDAPGTVDAEMFRLLRVSVEFATTGQGTNVLLVTSALTGEGKSTTASNLAVAIARGGKSVVLVDMDLRRPRIHDLLHVNLHPGVTDVVLGDVALEDALIDWTELQHQKDGPNPTSELSGTLRVLPAGTSAPAVGEFVGRSGVASLLSRLRELADVVIIDSPPFEVGDALTLSSHADAMIVVARLNRLHHGTVRRLRDIVRQAQTQALGIVITDAGRDSEYGYGYGYGYGGYFTETPKAIDKTTDKR